MSVYHKDNRQRVTRVPKWRDGDRVLLKDGRVLLVKSLCAALVGHEPVRWRIVTASGQAIPVEKIEGLAPEKGNKK